MNDKSYQLTMGKMSFETCTSRTLYARHMSLFFYKYVFASQMLIE